MILYLGASSLIKIYTEEISSDVARKWVRQAEIVATCRVAYTEIMSAIDKRFKEGDLSADDYDLLVNGFSKDWENLVTIDFDEFETGRLIKKYSLRRLDAIHLSAAKSLMQYKNDAALFFSSAKEELCEAAAAEGLSVLSFKPGYCS